ncbi:hypothetical protein Btru_067251 [Bulinus truncatus]|nr:hypothetical protein Btru_067251 [Bulinus truncatus]
MTNPSIRHYFKTIIPKLVGMGGWETIRPNHGSQCVRKAGFQSVNSSFGSIRCDRICQVNNMKLSKRTLSDGELFAQSKNRHESNHLKMRLDEIKIQEIQSSEHNRIEKFKWREFLRTNSRNSGNSSLASSQDCRTDEVESETPRSSRNFCDLQTVQKYQRQWVVAYQPHSYNKVYKEIEQAGVSLHRNPLRPAQSLSGGSSSSGDSSGLYRCATAAMGVKRVRVNWESMRPKTSSSDYRQVEISDINLNKGQRNYAAPWLRKEEESSKVVGLQQISSRRDSLTEASSSSNDNNASTIPQEPTSNVMLQRVSSMQAVAKSRLRWRCSICGKDKVTGEAEDKFAYTVLVYKDLTRILNNLPSKTTSTLFQKEVAHIEPHGSVSSPRSECSCRKTSAVVDNSERQVSHDTPVSNHASAQANHRKSSVLSTHSTQSRLSRRKPNIQYNLDKVLNTAMGDNLPRNSNPEIQLTDVVNNNHVTSPPNTSTLNSTVSTLTSLIDTSEENINDDSNVRTNDSVSNINLHSVVREHIAKDSCNDNRDNTVMLSESSNMILTDNENEDEQLTLAATNGEPDETNDVNSNSENRASVLNEDKNVGYKITLETEHNHPTHSPVTHELNGNNNNEINGESFEKPSDDSKTTSSQQKTQVLSVNSVESTRQSTIINKVSSDSKVSINLKEGEQFFKQVAQTMKSKLANDKRSVETLVVTARNTLPRMRKQSNLRRPVTGNYSNTSSVPSFHVKRMVEDIGNSHRLDGSNYFHEPNVNTQNAKVIHTDDAPSKDKNDKTFQHNVHQGNNTSDQTYQDDIVNVYPVTEDKTQRKISTNKTMSQAKLLADNSHSGDIDKGFSHVINQSARTSDTPTQLERETLVSASSKKETIRSFSARPYRSKENFPLKRHVEFKGVVIRDYIAPHLRYKTAASDRLKRPLSVKWHSSGGAVVTVHEKPNKSRLIDLVFPRQARQKQLLKMIEENHKKVPNKAIFTADAELRRRIDTFLKSVEPLCRR